MRLLNKREIQNTILLQISIILIFSLIYYFIGDENFSLNIFDKTKSKSKVTNYLDFLYFSFVISSTTGFGDIVPITDLSRMLVILQIFITYTSILRLVFVYK